METSLRYYGGGDSTTALPTVKYAGDVSSIKIHAKQKLQIDSNTLLELNGELDTRTGAPTFLCALVRHFYPDLSASVGAGLHYDKNEKFICTLRGKKAYPMVFNRSVNVVLKGRCDIDKELTQPTPHGALELVWNILDFQKDQDVRLKVGYEIVDKLPYAQIRENNWIFNADITGRWNFPWFGYLLELARIFRLQCPVETREGKMGGLVAEWIGAKLVIISVLAGQSARMVMSWIATGRYIRSHD